MEFVVVELLIVLLVVGIVMCCASSYPKHLADKKINRCKEKVSGEIIYLKKIYSRAYRRSNICKPIVKYCVNGIEYVKKASECENRNEYHVGQEVEVNYNFEKPYQFYITDMKFSFEFYNLVQRLGIACIIVAIIGIIIASIKYLFLVEIDSYIYIIKTAVAILFEMGYLIIGLVFFLAGIIGVRNAIKIKKEKYKLIFMALGLCALGFMIMVVKFFELLSMVSV